MASDEIHEYVGDESGRVGSATLAGHQRGHTHLNGSVDFEQIVPYGPDSQRQPAQL